MRATVLTLFVFVAYGSIAAFRYPAGAYGFHPYVYNPSQQEEEAQARQLFWSIRDLLAMNAPRNTVRATFTSTVNMICTKSMFRTCRVNQFPFKRAAVLSDIPGSEIIGDEEDDGEQFLIAPTAIQQVEATSEPTKQARAAEPHYFMNPRSYQNQFQDIQSAFYSEPYDPLTMPLYDSYPLPAAGQRQLSSGMLMTTLTVSTKLKINTVTLTPRCSKAGPIPQCPNA